MPKTKAAIILDGYSLTLSAAERIALGAQVSLSSAVRGRVERSRAVVKTIACESKVAIYAVNTGFGYLARERIPADEVRELQENILRSHAAGSGKPLSIPVTRLALALRLNLLAKGFSGVRFELCRAIMSFLKHGVYPLVPEYGSVGASGDLIPLAHLGLPLIGEGDVSFRGKVIPARLALRQIGMKPLKLVEKEGLSFVNGTEIMQAVGAMALTQALRLAVQADKIAALTFEGLGAHIAPLDSQIHRLRNQSGQVESARAILAELQGSSLLDDRLPRLRVQDPYSVRCAPQVHGPSRDALQYVKTILERELNAVTDNPLVLADRHQIVSGGNFHGQALAMAFDFAAIACAELANISERRLELLLNPHFSGLEAFLTAKPGVNSGYMALQYLCASLVNENKILSHPACTDSIPGNVGIEDHVSMGMTAARKFGQVVTNTVTVLCAELLASAQAVDLRKPEKLGRGTGKTYRTVRSKVKTLKRDRVVANDLANALDVLRSI